MSPPPPLRRGAQGSVARTAAPGARGAGPGGRRVWGNEAQRSVALGTAQLILLIVRSPEGEVVAEQLHDEGRVLVRLLVERVELSNGVVEGLFREIACF